MALMARAGAASFVLVIVIMLAAVPATALPSQGTTLDDAQGSFESARDGGCTQASIHLGDVGAHDPDQPDGSGESGASEWDPAQEGACKDLRDGTQRAAWNEAGGMPDAGDCYRPYSPGLGPIPYGPITPWSVCAQVGRDECDVLVRWATIHCFGGLDPDNA